MLISSQDIRNYLNSRSKQEQSSDLARLLLH